ncbi:restriction endonuclease subunit S, partial [Candidatus Pacearchaeota archaeon]|nr:restriction endonuclease subunit S [Candidatus Pacearchaeota archaeon]
ILDPACGTAGFLISAYKHILDKNTDGNRIKLTPDQRKKLAENIVGYDISPDMVRLSLVNLYLHGFKDPHIYEYDALTSDEKWDETYDVCLANPPFMTSKGGIKPHNRFSVKSNRSEVLFVDYMHEHLNNDGRAGIVVPEGIIFQSGKAYKDLRKTLIDNSLYAVVSLPAGVFNPYSGVKTSILFLDKRIAKKSSDILFVKVEADGFNLGAQRKEIKENDLPVALKILQSYQKTILEEGDFSSDKYDKRIAHIAPKETMKEQGWNLSGDKYKEELVYGGNWDLVELGDERYFKIESGGTPNTKIEEYWNGDIKWVTLTDLPAQNFITEITDTERTITNGGLRDSSAKLLPANSILISSRATIGKIAIAKTELATNQEFKNIIIKDFNKANEYFVAYMVSKLIERMNEMGTGGTFKEISKTAISSLKIPLPPLNVQEELVEEINKYRNIIDGAKKVIENYKPSFKIDKNWELVKLGKNAENLDAKRKPVTKSDRKKGQYPYYGASGIVDYVDGFIFDEDLLLISEDGANLRTRVTPIAFSVSGKIWVNNHAHVLKFKNKYTQIFVELYLNSISLENYITGSAQPKINKSSLNKIQIPLPDSDIQQEIVSYFEEEQKLIDGNKKLIEIFEEKIIDCISEVWKND